MNTNLVYGKGAVKLGFVDAQNDFFGRRLSEIEQKDLINTLSNNQRWCEKQVFVDEPQLLPVSNQNDKTTSLPSSVELTTPPQKKDDMLWKGALAILGVALVIKLLS